MGKAKNKRQRFLATHPWCCFCGGNRPATTIDHIPARTCFFGRQYPEGFEFPACDHCQSASRLDEMAFAFYARALDRNSANFDGPATTKMITGLANNLPHLLPNPFLDGRKKRDAFKRMGLRKPANVLAERLPVIEIDPELHQRIERYARKIACALYYREQERIASADHLILADWGQFNDNPFMDSSKGFIEMTPLITVGQRTNVNIGDQFVYRCNKCDDPDVLAALAGFGRGIVLRILVADPESAADIDAIEMPGEITGPTPWTRVIDNYPVA